MMLKLLDASVHGNQIDHIRRVVLKLVFHQSCHVQKINLQPTKVINFVSAINNCTRNNFQLNSSKRFILRSLYKCTLMCKGLVLGLLGNECVFLDIILYVGALDSQMHNELSK